MYYLIEHNRKTKKTTHERFSDYEKARTMALQKEQTYFQNGQNETEVVLFEANSLDDLKTTHSRYFADVNKNNQSVSANESILPDLLKVGIAVGLVSLAASCLLHKTSNNQ